MICKEFDHETYGDNFRIVVNLNERGSYQCSFLVFNTDREYVCFEQRVGTFSYRKMLIISDEKN